MLSDEDLDDDDNLVDTEGGFNEGRSTFSERMNEHIKLLWDFADGLEYQVQFNDHRMLQRLEAGSVLHSCGWHKIASVESGA